MANDRGGWKVAMVESTKVTERVAKWLILVGEVVH